MAKQKKLSSEIEENIQNLAGDIYVQIEDKITAIFADYVENIEIDSTQLKQHPDFIKLNDDNQQLEKQISQLNTNNEETISSLTTDKETLHSQLVQREQELENYAKLNTAKLTDTEQALKEKLNDNSSLTEQVTCLNTQYGQSQEALQETTEHLESLTAQYEQLQSVHETLEKNDKAKAATLSVQNQQISDLQLSNEQILSELEYLKAEQEKVAKSNLEDLSVEQQQASELKTSVTKLQKQNEQLNAQVQTLEEECRLEKTKTVENEKQLATNVKLNEKLAHEAENNVREISRLDRALNSEASLRKEADASYSQLNDALEDLKKEHSDKVAFAENKSQKLTSENKQLNEAGEKSIEQISLLETALVQEQLKVENSQSDAHTLRDQYEKVAGEHQSLKQNIETLTEQEKSLEISLSDERTKVANTSQLNTQQNKELIECRERILGLEDDNDSFSKQVAEFAKLIQDNELQLKTSFNENETLKKQHHQQLEKQKNEHENMLNEKETLLQRQAVQQQESKTAADTTISSLENKLDEHEKMLTSERSALETLKVNYVELNNTYTQQEATLNDMQKNASQLQLEIEKQKSITIQNRERVQENKNKQEVEYNKARETIKYLRDENTELNRKLVQEVNELEDKLTEYRLRFEYAQKQLTKMAK